MLGAAIAHRITHDSATAESVWHFLVARNCTSVDNAALLILAEAAPRRLYKVQVTRTSHARAKPLLGASNALGPLTPKAVEAAAHAGAIGDILRVVSESQWSADSMARIHICDFWYRLTAAAAWIAQPAKDPEVARD